MASITKHLFEHGVHKYFRGNAHQLRICTYGEKKDPIGPKAYLAPQANVKAEHLDGQVQIGTTAKINWTDVKRADLEADADLKFFGFGKKVAVGFDYATGQQNKLELANLFINELPLKKLLNTQASGALKFLAGEGKDARIVSEIWLWVDGELASFINANGKGSVGVKAFGSTIEIAIGGGKSGTQTLSYSDGTTFAYRLHKVSKWNKDKTQIVDMEDDYKGMN